MFRKWVAAVGLRCHNIAMRTSWLLAPLAFGVILHAAEFTSAPSLIPNPNAEVPLAALVRFTASTPVTTTVTVSEGSRQWEVRFGAQSNPAAGLPLIGFYPGRKHQITVEIRDSAGNTRRAPNPMEFAAPPLPAGAEEFPPIQVKKAGTPGMEPGWTLLSIRRQRRGGGVRTGAPPGEPAFATAYGLILLLDEHGQVVWYYKSPNRTAGVHRLRNGNIAFLTNDSRLVEIDLLGNVKGNWCAARRPNGPCTGTSVDALTMHHTFTELPNGNFLVLGGELREIDNYYTSETDREAPRKRQKVMGDQVIEFDRAGRVVWRWSAFEHLDVYRLGFLTINQYWIVRGFPDTLDWTHGNGVFHDERDNSVLFNSRQQSAVVKIERPSGRVAWIFGEPGGWPDKFQPLLFRPEGVSEWPWHHHAPTLTSGGTLMMFNNGIYK
ncbi:MAG: hypothetical protein EXQ52_07660, partial [Bryobacterales bacterium]|nr:hypothetical protein [Bryobacterales bacterium]